MPLKIKVDKRGLFGNAKATQINNNTQIEKVDLFTSFLIFTHFLINLKLSLTPLTLGSPQFMSTFTRVFIICLWVLNSHSQGWLSMFFSSDFSLKALALIETLSRKTRPSSTSASFARRELIPPTLPLLSSCTRKIPTKTRKTAPGLSKEGSSSVYRVTTNKK